MKKEPVISVIIPTFNSERFIIDCLKSICSQTFSLAYEIIVVDGNSTDSTKYLINNFHCDNLTLIVNKTNGVSLQRNIGIDKARGKFISFLDSDDVVSKDYLEVLYRLIVQHDSDISICGYQEFTDKIYSADDKSISTYYMYANLKDFYIDSYKKGFLISCSKLYKKQVIGDIRFNTKIGYGEDTDFNFYIFNRNVKVSFTSKVLYFYRFHNNNVVHTPNDNMLTMFIGQINHIRYIESNSIKEIVPYAIDRLYWSLNQSYLMFWTARKKFNFTVFKEIRHIIIKHIKVLKNRKIRKLLFLFFPNLYCAAHALRKTKI